jgi:hypothetical protein
VEKKLLLVVVSKQALDRVVTVELFEIASFKTRKDEINMFMMMMMMMI